MRSVLMLMVAALSLGRLALAGEADGPVKVPKPGAKPAVGVEAKVVEETEAEKKIKETLKAKRVTFDFVETPMGDAVEFMRTLTNVNMVIAPDVDRGATLTLKANDMPVGQALQWMARLVDAKTDVREGALVFERGKEGKGGEEREPGLKPKPAKGPFPFEFDKFRRLGASPLAKAVIPLGNGASVELNLEEEDLDPDTRRVLLKLFQRQLVAELEKHDKKAAAEFQEALEKRARLEAEEGARRAAEEGARRGLEVHERLRDLREKLRDKIHKLPKPEPRGDENKAQF